MYRNLYCLLVLAALLPSCSKTSPRISVVCEENNVGNSVVKWETIPEIPGLAVWHEGHIGIYIGNGEVIHAANTNAGVIKTPIGDSGWTHWLKIPYITYAEETEESTE